MKLLVETTGNFGQICATTRQEIHWNRPTVVQANSSIQQMVALGNVKVFYDTLPDEASDSEFALWLKECDGNVELAVESYVAKYRPTALIAADAGAAAAEVTPKTKGAK